MPITLAVQMCSHMGSMKTEMGKVGKINVAASHNWRVISHLWITPHVWGLCSDLVLGVYFTSWPSTHDLILSVSQHEKPGM